MHPFDTDLTSTILRPIDSRLRSFFPQVGRGARTEADPNPDSSITGQRGLFSRDMQYFHITNKRGPYLFPFAFFKPQSLLDLHGPVLYLFSHFDFLHYTPFPSPPPPYEGGLMPSLASVHTENFVLAIFTLISY